jgi:hypothetical protein
LLLLFVCNCTCTPRGKPCIFSTSYTEYAVLATEFL